MVVATSIDWEDAWRIIHEKYAMWPSKIIDHRSGSRALSFDNRILIARNELGFLSKDLVGYSNLKIKAFDRKYVVAGLKEKIGDKLVERMQAGKKLTVLSYHFNVEGGDHDQGACVTNIMIRLLKSSTGWSIKYQVNIRTAEVTRRLLVDLIKFQEIINYWETRLAEIDSVLLIGIVLTANVLYMEPFAAQFVPLIFPDYKFDKNHWFHHLVQKKINDPNRFNIKFHRGLRINKHIARLTAGGAYAKLQETE